MRFKLDECLDIRLAQLFKKCGHNVKTVFDEKLSGASDDVIYQNILEEKRILVTQDLDFSNPFRFSPKITNGIIVFRNPSQLFKNAEILVKILLQELSKENPNGQLWVVGKKGIRIWPSE